MRVYIRTLVTIVTVLNFVDIVVLLDIYNIFSKGKALKENAFDTLSVYGVQTCVRECLLRSKCKVVSFHLEQYRCELGEKQGLLQPTTDQKYIFSENPSSYTTNLGPCANNVCPLGTKCIWLTSGQRSCIQTECNDPPLIANSTTGGSKAFDGTITYTCNSGFYPHGKDTITCKLNGEWTSTSFRCESQNDCPEGFTYVNEKPPEMQKFCYKLLDVGKVNQSIAVEHCAAENSSLLIVDSKTKMDALSSLPSSPWYWVDGMDEGDEDNWKYSDGTPLNRDIFDGGQPNGGLAQNCMAFNSRQGFHDRQCEYTYQPLCEYKI